MPTYQYRCIDCGHDLEAVQKFSDPALTSCPACAGSLRKKFNAVGVVFKGSGFYRTDSRRSSGHPEGNGDSGTKSGEKVGVGAKDKGASGGKDAGSGGSQSAGNGSSSSPAGASTKSSTGSATAAS